MKLISLGNIDKIFLIYASIYIVVTIVLNIISIILQNNEDNIKNLLKNISVMIINIHGSLIFAIIFQCYLNKVISNRKPENIIKEEDNNNERIIYIYNKPKKENDKKSFFLLILMIIFDYIYDGGLMFYQKNYVDSELVFDEIFKFLDVLFLFAFFRIFHKIEFYRHQYISLFIILFMGLIKFLVTIFYDEELNKNIIKNFNVLSVFFMIFFSLLDSINIYFLQKFMLYNYYIPYYISFLIGVIYFFLSIIVIIIFYFIDCKESEICQIIFNKDMELPNFGQIILLIFYSIFYSAQHFLKLLTINNCTVFHFILIETFGELINSFFKIYPIFRTFDLITNIIVYSF